MADVNFFQGFVNATSASDGGDAQISQAYVLAATQFPSEAAEITQSFVSAAVQSDRDVHFTQGFVLAAVRGRIDDPKVRAWTYSMDGHDFYVLRLGNIETLVYDTMTGQWYVWGSGTTDLWRPFDGINWLGGNEQAYEYGSNVIVGDDGNGSLYFLDPDYAIDQKPLYEAETNEDTEAFERVFQGQMVKRGRDSQRDYGLELLGSVGKMDISTLTDITLYISDDRGENYTDMGTVSIPNDDLDKRVEWRSLGSFEAPGRLYKFVDTGALVRIDNVTIDTDRE